MENAVVQWLVGICGGGSLGIIIASIIVAIAKKGMSKANQVLIQKSNNEDLIKKITNQVFDLLKNAVIEFKATPLVESELQKINEYATKVVNETFGKMIQSNLDIINILDKFTTLMLTSAYNLNEKEKAELINAIKKAKENVGVKDGTVKVEFVEKENVSCETKEEVKQENFL